MTFFWKMGIFIIPPLIPQKCVFCLKNIKISNIYTDIPKIPYKGNWAKPIVLESESGIFL